MAQRTTPHSQKPQPVQESREDSLEPLNVAHSTAAAEVIWSLSCGNKRYLDSMRGVTSRAPRPLLDMLIDDPLKPAKVKALVISCARSFAPIDSIFDVEPGNVQVVRVCGYVGGKNSGVTGSVEFALAKSAPPVLIVLGNSQNDPVESALRCVLKQQGKDCSDVPLCSSLMCDYKEEDLGIVKAIMPAAKDAVMQKPNACFEELAELTGKLNVWNTIEQFLKTSRTMCDMVLAGKLEIHGAYFHVRSGKVQFLGQHPSQAAQLSELPPMDIVRTAEDPTVPAEEALGALFAGNRRYSVGKGSQTHVLDQRLLIQLSEGGQNPIAVVLGCADSRAPVEILFDMRPGDLFVLRNAGNSCASAAGSVIGSAEYAVDHLRTKLLVVSGHTKCGAVTAAVDSVRKKLNVASFGGSIGEVLSNIQDCAVEAVSKLPNGTLLEQVKLATELNVFATMEKLIKFSPLIKKACQNEDVQVHGAVYDIFTGAVEWLGQHPELEKIVEKPLPVHKWRLGAYTRPPFSVCSKGAEHALARLRDGNNRFVNSNLRTSLPGTMQNPYAMVISGAELRVPVEKIFDVEPGDLIVQRVMGNIAGHPGGALFASIEYAIVRFQPKLLMVLGESHSCIIQSALQQVAGAEVPTPPMRIVLDRVMVSAVRAVQQVKQEKALTLAGRDMKIRQLCVEFNVFYTIEQLFRSAIVRNLVKNHGLELHAAVLDETSGVVDIIGRHPLQAEIIALHEVAKEADTDVNEAPSGAEGGA